MIRNNENSLLEKQYRLAIEARDKLNDNFHKWMTYYYVANGAILVAITSLASKSLADRGILVLSLIGVFVCILWNLSCKGYSYWSKSWIDIVIKLEENIIKNNWKKFGVYSVFSKSVADKEDISWKPNKAANISTPKLTLFFSLFSLVCWIVFSIWEFYKMYSFHHLWLLTSGAVIILIVYFLLPRFVKSRKDEKDGGHKLI